MDRISTQHGKIETCLNDNSIIDVDQAGEIEVDQFTAPTPDKVELRVGELS